MKEFGTDGIRGIVGQDFDLDLVIEVGKAIAAMNVRQVIIGWDTRASCDFIVSTLSGILAASGINVTQVGIVPTAAIGFLTKKLGVDMGIMVTASHNDARYNGIKLFSKDARKLSNLPKHAQSRTVENVGRIIQNFSVIKIWERFLVKNFKKTFQNNCLKVAVDCANGSGTEVAKRVFSKLGIAATFYNTNQNGKEVNENCGAMHPDSLRQIMQKEVFDVGFAFDGDADRCVVLCANGERIHGDILIVLLAKFMNAQRVVSTILFNSGGEEELKKNGIKLTRTAVGDRHIINELKTGELGGETCGHIIFPDIYMGGDGLITALVVLNMLISNDKKLSELCAEIKVWESEETNFKTLVSESETPSLRKGEIKEFWNGNTRTVIRASGTEDIIRVFREKIPPL